MPAAGNDDDYEEEEIEEEEVIEEEVVEEEIVEELQQTRRSSRNDYDDDDDDEDLKKLQWEKPAWAKKQTLKSTSVGQKVKAGSNLSKPVTMVNANKDVTRDVNFTANPNILKSTEQGSTARSGENLAVPITNISEVAQKEGDKLGWEKPNWAKKPVLKSTDKGEKAKEGSNLASEVTHINESENKIGWEKPSWAKGGAKLRSTGNADTVKTGGNLSKEITHINANKDTSRDINSAANSDMLQKKGESGGNDISWEKPSWASNAGLKSTKKGQKMKEKGDIARPITFPKGK